MKGSVFGVTNDSKRLNFSVISPTIAAAHELKAPLALIRQLSLYLESDNVSHGERERLLQQITLTSERGLRLTNDLSRTARLDDSLFSMEPLNPIQICEGVVEELSPLFMAKHSTLSVAQKRTSPTVVGNRQLLHRVLSNFADNALHYSESTRPVQFQVSSSQAGATVRLAVRDYGPAVPLDIWKRVYQNLGHASQTLQSRPQSSGLGLYVAGEFARVMRGQIGAIRHKDGATFYIDLAASTQLRLL